MDTNPVNNNSTKEEIVDFSLRDFIKFCLRKWVWFTICIVFSIGIALLYIYRKEPVYERYEQILVNDQNSKGGVGEISNVFSSLGLFTKKSNVYNELITLTSPAIMYVVADSLQLYMNYLLKDGFRAKTLYGSSLPFRVDMLDLDPQESASFKMKINSDKSLECYKFVFYQAGEKIKYKDKIRVQPGQNEFDSPIGRIKLSPNSRYKNTIEDDSYVVAISKMSMQGTAELYGEKLTGDLADEDADVIELSIKDQSVERAVDILNNILLVYNQNWIDDKNKIALATSDFIDDRLRDIERDLGTVDQSIADYLKRTGVPDLKVSTRISMEFSSKIEEELMKASNELSIANYMKQYLNENNDITVLLPVNLGIENQSVATQIISYNELLLTRNSVLNSSSVNNPLVENYDRQLEGMRNAIVVAVDNLVNNLQNSVDNLRSQISRMSENISNTPEINLPLLSEERQRMVMQNLYIFLLQKKAENELTQKFSAESIRVITPPIGSLKPIAPKKALILIVALILGFGIPLVILYYLETSDTKVRNKNDLNPLLIPFAGEIPQVVSNNKIKGLPDKVVKIGKKKEEAPVAVVEEGKRDIVNEAFRVLRGNISFMCGKVTQSPVIMLTSFNPGSGKSFIAFNLGMSFTLKNKRVLLIDCDLRHGSTSMYVGMPNRGLTDYLNGTMNDWKDLIVTFSTDSNFSIMPIGKIPPNPAELLENGRLNSLIEEAKQNFDFIFLDCPPVNIVVDSQIIAPLADRTLFIVRAGLLERSALNELNEFYKDKKFNNLSVVLNGTEAFHSVYYTYGNYQHLNK